MCVSGGTEGAGATGAPGDNLDDSDFGFCALDKEHPNPVESGFEEIP